MHRDPPHWLKPLQRTLLPKRLAYFYCVSGVTMERGNQIHRTTGMAFGTTHWTRRSGERKDSVAVAADTGILWGSILDFCAPSRRTVLWTFDLGEQIRLSRMLPEITVRGWRVDKMVLEPGASWMLLRHDKRSLMICDLRAWTPVEWDTLRKGVKHACDKRTRNLDHVSGPAAQARRATIEIAQIVDDLMCWLESENAGSFRPTGSGQSYACYRRRFHTEKLLVHDDRTALPLEREAMHAGRAEAWRHGKLTGGPFLEMDMRTAYTRIASTREIPSVLRGQIYRPTMRTLERYARRYAIMADATVTVSQPCVPVRTETRTVWPVGTFRTILWDPELSMLGEHAQSVHVHRAWRYSTSPALQPFSQWVMNQLDSKVIDGPPIAQHVLKHWSRSLVGRFGLRFRSWEAFSDAPEHDLRLVTYSDEIEGIVTDMLVVGKDRFVLADMQEGAESMPQIPGWIMSECRRRLWATMQEIGLDAVCYVDTDSIIIDLSKVSMTRQEVIDKYAEWWAPKRTWRRLTINGPRNLSLDGERRIAGIPVDARQTGPSQFTGTVLKSVRHALASGRLDHVERVPRHFHLTTPDMRRVHNDDGTTSPYTLELECIQDTVA